MATYTENFNLEKPAQNEAVDVDVLNSNSDIIDDNLGQAKQLALNIGYGYNNSVPYFVGDYCVYQNKLYKCIQNILTPEDFDETKWQQCTLGGELQNIKGNTDDNVTDVLVKLKIGEKVYKICDFANKNLANEYSASSTYEVGDYVIYEDDLYKCTTAVSVAEPFDSTKWTSCLVTDEMGSGSGGGIDYSTTEQKTGQKWINGKDIYQTTIHLESGDFTIGGRTDGISNGLSNVETIITKDAIGIHSNGSGTAYFSNYFPTSDSYICQIFDIGATAFSIYVGSGFSSMTDIYVTFQYTKSTT